MAVQAGIGNERLVPFGRRVAIPAANGLVSVPGFGRGYGFGLRFRRRFPVPDGYAVVMPVVVGSVVPGANPAGICLTGFVGGH